MPAQTLLEGWELLSQLTNWKVGGAARFLGVGHLHDSEPFVPGSSLLPKLIT